MSKNRLKVIAGILLMFMGILELDTGFLAYPSVMIWSATRTEWWATHLPIVMLFNSLVASVLCMYLGLKLTKEGSLFTEKQDERLRGKLDRWFEKKKYGYNRSDFVIKKETQ